jgi:hypothetical protein
MIIIEYELPNTAFAPDAAVILRSFFFNQLWIPSASRDSFNVCGR